MPLFAPFKLGPLTLPNRVVMAPLTRRRAGVGKIPTELNALHYEQRASAGLIISESTEVDPHSGGDLPTRPGIFNEAQAAGWRARPGTVRHTDHRPRKAAGDRGDGGLRRRQHHHRQYRGRTPVGDSHQ